MTEAISAKNFIITNEDGSHTLNVMVDGMHCPSCVAIIENALKKQSEIVSARLNLSTKRLKIIWNGEKGLGDKWLHLINSMGYNAKPFDIDTSETFEKREEKYLLKCMAVAGFASGNMMLFSVPMWSANGIEMGEITRTMFHLIQIIIAIPTIFYSGAPFFSSAINALKEKQSNMDVPISIAVLLATIMSLYEIANKGQHAYLDSAVMLLFFLLIGRYLDARARGKARGAAQDLLQMMKGVANVLQENGEVEQVQFSDLKEGMKILVSAGEKIGADGNVVKGESELDTSLITGETLLQKVGINTKVFAGTVNISSPLQIIVTKPGENSLLAEIIKVMENAEQSQSRYISIAEKISGWYTPLVLSLGIITFIAWYIFAGDSWQEALLIASTVLIITCPCALGLAVPVVQVLASGKLMRGGILIKSGSALERLAKISDIVFDKTGTITIGRPELLDIKKYDDEQLKLAASLAAHSKHPLSLAVKRAHEGSLIDMHVTELPGMGLQAEYKGKKVRLGKRSWCGIKDDTNDDAMEIWLDVEGEQPLRFLFADQLKQDAGEIIESLDKKGFKTHLFSGDRREVVESVAKQVGIKDACFSLSPIEKTHKIEALKKQGAKVLMVGDGLNDAPSLAIANVSMSPTSAIDITQNAADVVFQGDKLDPIRMAIETAKFSQILVKQNFILALLYNVIAVPIAVLGYVTPLIAAIAMSGSSLVVIANAMRLRK